MTTGNWAEPYKIKMVELIKMTSREDRLNAIREAGYNTFLLRSEDVYIDLLTDSGVGAMSDRQWAGIMMGDEAYAGSRNYYRLRDTVEEYYSYKYTVPCHQGRGAENILSQILISPGDYVPGNMYFTTTRLHQELAGATFVDVIIDEAHDADSEHPFKGNVDFDKLDALVDEVGADKIPYVCIATCVNMAGGQPISMANLKQMRAWCDTHDILLVHDMTRVAENAHFIQRREEGYLDTSIKEIVYEICSLTDAATMSSKKDAMVNIGGFLAMNDARFAGSRHPHRQSDWRPRRVPQCDEDAAEHPTGSFPGTGVVRSFIRRVRRAFHGARHRLRRPRQGNGRKPQTQSRTRAPDHSAPRLHAGAYGCDGWRSRGSCAAQRRDQRSTLHLRA